MQKPAFLEFKNLDVGYDNKPVLKNFSAKIYPGEFVGLLGPNGSGKSTLLKTILGLLPPLKGKVVLQDASSIAYVPQRMALNPSIPLSCEEFLRLKYKEKLNAKDVAEALELVDLQGFEKRSVHELSGGQMQRLFIAFALLGKPKLICLDEATEGMDMTSLAKFFENLKHKVATNDAALIFVSHDISAVSEHCSRVICLQEGIHFDGDPKSPEFHTCLHQIYGEKSSIHGHHHH